MQILQTLSRAIISPALCIWLFAFEASAETLKRALPKFDAQTCRLQNSEVQFPDHVFSRKTIPMPLPSNGLLMLKIVNKNDCSTHQLFAIYDEHMGDLAAGVVRASIPASDEQSGVFVFERPGLKKRRKQRIDRVFFKFEQKGKYNVCFKTTRPGAFLQSGTCKSVVYY